MRQFLLTSKLREEQESGAAARILQQQQATASEDADMAPGSSGSPSAGSRRSGRHQHHHRHGSHPPAQLPSPLLQPVEAVPVTSASLLAAYQGPCPYERDGLLLLHKELQYASGITPLALVWKDANCSRYFIDTDAQGLVPERQQVILEYRMDCTVATEDEPPVVLGRIPPELAGKVPGLEPGALVRFSIGDKVGQLGESAHETWAALKLSTCHVASCRESASRMGPQPVRTSASSP